MAGSREFIFTYKHKQIIYIKVNFLNKTQFQDTAYIPSNFQCDSIIDYICDDFGRIKIAKGKFFHKRKNFVYQHENASIVLFNILNQNFSKFYQSVKTYTSGK